MKKTAIYRIWSEQTLLYVGISDNPWLRIYSHSAGKDWFGLVTNVEIEWVEGRQAALKAERKAIADERPAKNKDNPIKVLSEKSAKTKNALADWIAKSGMTQAEFSDLCGVHFTAMSRITSNKKKPSYAAALRIEAATSGVVSLSSWGLAPVARPDVRSQDSLAMFDRLFCDGLKAKEIASQMKVSEPIIRDIAREKGLNWKHIRKGGKHADQIKKLASMGLSGAQAAKEIGVPASVVSRCAKLYGVKFADGRKKTVQQTSKKRMDQKLAVEKLARQGLTVTQVAKELQIDQPYVSRLKSEFNIEFLSVKARSLPPSFEGSRA